MPAPGVMEAAVTERGRTEAQDQQQAGGDLAARGKPRLAASAPRLLRVLVIDDDQDTADSLARLVRDWGHEVRWAYDAGVGLTSGRCGSAGSSVARHRHAADGWLRAARDNCAAMFV